MPGVLCAAGVAQMIAERVEGAHLYKPQRVRPKRQGHQNDPGHFIRHDRQWQCLWRPDRRPGMRNSAKERYLAAIHQRTDKPVFHIYIQEEGGIEKTVAKGLGSRQLCWQRPTLQAGRMRYRGDHPRHGMRRFRCHLGALVQHRARLPLRSPGGFRGHHGYQ